MRVRIQKSERTSCWYVYVKNWWWPFWVYRTFELTQEEARERAKQIKYTYYEEIT